MRRKPFPNCHKGVVLLEERNTGLRVTVLPPRCQALPHAHGVHALVVPVAENRWGLHPPALIMEKVLSNCRLNAQMDE